MIFHRHRAIYERNLICQPDDVMYVNSLGHGKNYQKVIFHKRRSGIVPIMDDRFIPRLYQNYQEYQPNYVSS